MRTLPCVLLLSCAPLFAEESAVLERLQQETRALVTRARPCLVTVEQGHPAVQQGHPAVHWYGQAEGAVLGYLFARQHARGGVGAVAVHVGRGVLVVPADRETCPPRISVTWNGRHYDATRLAADGDLDIAFYRIAKGDLPADAPALLLERNELGPGTLGVMFGAGEEDGLRLVVVSRAGRGSGEVGFEPGDVDPVVVGIDGSVLALLVGARVAPRHVTDAPWDSTRALTLGSYARPRYLAGHVIRRLLEDIEQHGRIRRARLGVVVGDATDADGSTRVVISTVLQDSPAARAGLAAGARISAVEGEPCANSVAFTRMLAVRRPGDKVRLTLAPDGTVVTVELGSLADVSVAGRYRVDFDLGLEWMALTPDLRRYLEIADDVQGVVVAGDPPGSGGFRRGDVILAVGSQPTPDPESLEAALATVRGTVTVKVLREGKEILVALGIPEVPTGPPAGVR